MKNFRRSFLPILVVVMVLLSSMPVSFAYTPPNLSNVAYTTSNPFYNAGYSGQCTWFAWGRTKEVLGISLGTPFMGNANSWYNETVYPKGQTAANNCIAVFGGGSYGHVVYVEYVSGDTIYYNEANYHVTGWYDGALESASTAAFKARSPGGFLGFVYVSTPPSGTNVIVDDGDAGFTKYGPSGYWHSQAIGYNGDMIWTYGNGSVVSNYCQWKPSLPSAGTYTVQVYIPSNYATANATYSIVTSGGTYTKTVNQNSYYNQWVTLGSYYFSANGTEYVKLTDATGETSSMVGFDAVQFSK